MSRKRWPKRAALKRYGKSQNCISGPRTRWRRRTSPLQHPAGLGGNNRPPRPLPAGQASCLVFTADAPFVETRLLISNADPVFQDRALAILDEFDGIETRVVRTMPEAVSILLDENFDGSVVEGETPIAMEQATSARQHFPTLMIVCLSPRTKDADAAIAQQKIRHIASDTTERNLRKQLQSFVSSLAQGGTPAEGIDPCHSLIGNLNQFSAAEILQMSCLGQRDRKSTRLNS